MSLAWPFSRSPAAAQTQHEKGPLKPSLQFGSCAQDEPEDVSLQAEPSDQCSLDAEDLYPCNES